MKIFGKLNIHGKAEELDRFPDQIDSKLSDGWTRNQSGENRLRQMDDARYYGFTCTKREARQEADLWLLRTASTDMSVVNIVPTTSGSLSIDEYNSLLEEFYEKFAEPTAAELGLDLELGDFDVTLEHWVSAATLEKLHSFSILANKSTGSAHPCDGERWYDFLIAVHLEDSKLDVTNLQRWLIEEEGWTEEIADRLVLEFESAQSLLKYYDRTCPSR